MIHFLIGFILLLLVGSLFILGFHTITRGKYVVLPNGEKEKEVEIFGFWQLFWEDIKKYKRVYYEGDQLLFKLKILEQVRPQYVGEVNPEGLKRSLIFKKELTQSEIRDIEFVLNCKVHNNGIAVFLYEEHPVYRFPEWVRKMTNCFVCQAGWLGTTFYWVYVSFFPFFDVSAFQKVLIWVVFCISLSFVNKIIKQNLDE